MAVKAIRGAISIQSDEASIVKARTKLLLETIFERNNLASGDIISIFFTATEDITSVAPAAGAREWGLIDVPMLCAQEMSVDNPVQGIVRCFIHTECSGDIEHVFLGKAATLRSDIARLGDEEL